MYPEEVLKAFNDSDIFVPLSSHSRSKTHRLPKRTDTTYWVREGRDEVKQEMGIEIADEDETQQSADIFTKLKVRRDQVPMKPLTEGKLE
jgi:hypothetical protein